MEFHLLLDKLEESLGDLFLCIDKPTVEKSTDRICIYIHMRLIKNKRENKDEIK